MPARFSYRYMRSSDTGGRPGEPARAYNLVQMNPFTPTAGVVVPAVIVIMLAAACSSSGPQFSGKTPSVVDAADQAAATDFSGVSESGWVAAVQEI